MSLEERTGGSCLLVRLGFSRESVFLRCGQDPLRLHMTGQEAGGKRKLCRQEPQAVLCARSNNINLLEPIVYLMQEWGGLV